MKAKKGHQRTELQKIIDFINNQCKIINKLECDTKKKLFFKNGKFSFSLHKILEITFCKKYPSNQNKNNNIEIV